MDVFEDRVSVDITPSNDSSSNEGSFGSIICLIP